MEFLRSSPGVVCAALLVALPVASQTSVAAAASPPRPPDGTYSYTLSVSGTTYGTFTDVIDGSAAGTVAVRESASVPVQRIAETSVTRYDAATLRERSYAADFTLPNGKQHTDATVTVDAAHVVATPGGQADIGLVPATAFVLTTDNQAGWNLLIPSMLHASGATSFTLAVLSGGSSVAVQVVTDAPPARPAAAASGDVSVTIAFAGLRETLWYDPATYVVHDIVIPAQNAEFRLTKVTAARATPATPGLAVALPTPLPHFSAREVQFTSADGTVLAGTLTVPDGAQQPRPAIVLVHGSGPNDRDETIGPNPIFLQLSNALSNDGYVVLRYDKRGIGKSGGAQTGGTREELLADVAAAFAFVSMLPEVDSKHVFLLGHSEGGELVPTVAARQPKVAGIILLAPPALPLAQISLQQVLALAPPARREEMETEERGAQAQIRKSTARADAWYRSSLDVDPVVDIARVRVPILILQGLADVQVLAADLPRLVAAARAASRDVTVDTFDGLNHLFEPVPAGVTQTPKEAVAQYFTVPARVDDRVLAAIASWLHAHAD